MKPTLVAHYPSRRGRTRAGATRLAGAAAGLPTLLSRCGRVLLPGDSALARLVPRPLSLDLTVPPLLWHAHQTLFGFGVAVIVGFLPPDCRQGSDGTRHTTRAGLGALAGLWLAARLAAVVGPYALYAVLDLSLLPLVAGILVAVLIRAGNRRNLPLAGMLIALSVVNLLFHLLSMLGTVPTAAAASVARRSGLDRADRMRHGRSCRSRVHEQRDAGPEPQAEARIGAGHAGAHRAGAAVLGLRIPTWFALGALAAAGVADLARQWAWQPWVTRTGVQSCGSCMRPTVGSPSASSCWRCPSWAG